MQLLRVLLIISISLLSCSGKTKNSRRPAEIKTGTISTLHCINAPLEDYALYLPEKYDASKKHPTIIFLDSHGKGNYPVGLYKSLSEKYGIIMAGSNKIKNGMQMNDAFSVYLDLLYDLKKRFTVDTAMIFLCGFSGGARMASIIALSQPNISGVIACSAGMDPGMLKYNPAFPYVCTAGIADMNYSEMVSLNKQMKTAKMKSQLLVFNGKHEWPPLDVMDESILFLILKNISKTDIAKNKAMISLAKSKLSAKIDSVDKNQPLKWLHTEEQYVDYLEGLADVSEPRRIADSLINTEAVKTEMHHENFLQNKEESSKKTIQEAFLTKTIDWWKTEVASLNQKIKSSPEIEAGMYRRVLSYASLVSFSYVSRTLSSNQPEAANNYLQIYSLVDPENPDCAYFKACYYAHQQDHYNTIRFLNEAIDKGFSDLDKIKAEPAFSNLQYDSDFLKAVSRLKQ